MKLLVIASVFVLMIASIEVLSHGDPSTSRTENSKDFWILKAVEFEANPNSQDKQQATSNLAKDDSNSAAL